MQPLVRLKAASPSPRRLDGQFPVRLVLAHATTAYVERLDYCVVVFNVVKLRLILQTPEFYAE